MIKLRYAFAAGAIALSLGGAAQAQDHLPALQKAGSVEFLSGGIGLDESTAIRAAAKNFSLSLLFVQNKRGEYLSDVKVSISDRSGKEILQTLSDGPMLLARLPAGDYSIVAEYDGKKLSKRVSIGVKRTTSASFVWHPEAKATIE